MACEIEPSARKTILLNKPKIGLLDDVQNLTAEDIRKFAGLTKEDEIDLIAGGPPCQAFSTAGKREGFNDSRGNVFLTYIDLVLELSPNYILIENVRGLLSAPLKHRPHTRRGRGYPPLSLEEQKGGALNHIISKLKDAGYSVSFNLYNSANYGTPQKRERVIIIANKSGEKLPFLTPTHSENGQFGLKYWVPFEEVYPKNAEVECLKFPESRIKYYKLLGPGEYWKHLPEKMQKQAMGNSYFAGGGKTGFFRRLAWDKPSPTLVTNPTMPATDLSHPEENRPLSVMEYKRIQQIPDSWVIFGKTVEKYKQIGNAVPVGLGEAAGKTIMNHIKGKSNKTYPGFSYSRYKNTCHDSYLGKKYTQNKNTPTLFE